MQDRARPGMATEIVLAAFEAAGMTTTLEYYPWPRCELMIKQGHHVATFPYVETAARKEFGKFSEAMLSQSTYLYYADQTLAGSRVAQLGNATQYTVGSLHGYVHYDRLRQKGIEPTVVKSNVVGLGLLLLGRIDFFPLNDLVARHLIDKHYADLRKSFHRLPEPLYREELHLMVSRWDPEGADILEAFNRGLAIIRNNGKLNEIRRKYQ